METNMDRSVFFPAVRSSLFGGHLTQQQVDGMAALLDACDREKVTDLRHVAYILATPMIETGGSFIPITESLNYSSTALSTKFGRRITPAQAAQYGRTAQHPANQEAIGNIIYGGAWGKANLGNTEPGDGYLFRGRGLVQTTGRRLYELFGYADNPDGVRNINASSDIMVKGMRDGIFTGRKLSDYFNSIETDWRNARRTVNGTDRADDIAAYAVKFYAALKDAA